MVLPHSKSIFLNVASLPRVPFVDFPFQNGPRKGQQRPAPAHGLRRRKNSTTFSCGGAKRMASGPGNEKTQRGEAPTIHPRFGTPFGNSHKFLVGDSGECIYQTQVKFFERMLFLVFFGGRMHLPYSQLQEFAILWVPSLKLTASLPLKNKPSQKGIASSNHHVSGASCSFQGG